ncbi:MAG: hypothetical protein JSR58_06645 [Verrucomicrobia bacterium]|nr:hypothetical protein [Verrucomicrobiota bacterium]
MNILKKSLRTYSMIALGSHFALIGPGQKPQKKHVEEPSQKVQPSQPVETPAYPFFAEVSVAFENFRGLPDGSWQGNTGAYTSLNFGFSRPSLSKHGYGMQLAGSFGLYEWQGRGALFSHISEIQQQGFITAGLFRNVPQRSGINFNLVVDWMFNDNFGVFSLNPNFGQLRAALAYLFGGSNELGLWGTYGVSTSHHTTDGIPVEFRAISQINLFWRHYFFNGAQAMVWAGVPYRKGLMFESGPAGTFIAGVDFKVPLTRRWSIDGHAAYMGPRSSPGEFQSRRYASDIAIALTYSFGSTKVEKGKKDSFGPYFPMANNSNFLTDTNLNF